MARTVSKTETWVGYAILLVLVVIAGGIFLIQSRYEQSILKPGLLQTESPSQDVPLTSSLRDLIQFAPDSLTPLTPPETFGPENLSDKINGKAELYLSAGFVGLVSQRFAIENEPTVWMEAFIYDMGSPRGSYAVYSLQKRSEATELDTGDFAYRTENALYFVHGSYYVEIVASVAQESMAKLILSFGDNFVGKTTAGSEAINEFSLFPSKYLNKASISLLPSDAFGFQQFDSIFTAQYEVEDTELTAFLSQRKSPAEAVRLVESYTSFLREFGGTELRSTLNIPGVKLVEIMDTFELIFSRGSILAGVHAAENRKAAEELALMLNQSLAEKGK
ncbi:MAG: DUF6599 family protein [Syntrophobacteria bacterium]|jgi:hypothetical protein